MGRRAQLAGFPFSPRTSNQPPTTGASFLRGRIESVNPSLHPQIRVQSCYSRRRTGHGGAARRSRFGGRGVSLADPPRSDHRRDHGSARHDDHQCRAATDGRQSRRDDPGDRVGEHRLHPIERRRAADDGLLHREVRAKELPVLFDHPLRRRLVSVRDVEQPRRAGVVARRPGRGRSGPAVHGAGDVAADLPARAAGSGAGDFHHGYHRRADPRSHTRWVDHRQLSLGMVLLHQHPDRDRRRLSRHELSARLAACQAPQRRGGLVGYRPAHDRSRVPAVRARGRAREGLVQRRLDR